MQNFRGKSLIGEGVVAALAASFEKRGVKAKVRQCVQTCWNVGQAILLEHLFDAVLQG